MLHKTCLRTGLPGTPNVVESHIFVSSLISVVNCGPPPTLDNGRLTETPTNTTAGSTIMYVCDNGYVFEEGSAMFRTCLETGEWSNEYIKCRRECKFF